MSCCTPNEEFCENEIREVSAIFCDCGALDDEIHCHGTVRYLFDHERSLTYVCLRKHALCQELIVLLQLECSSNDNYINDETVMMVRRMAKWNCDDDARDRKRVSRASSRYT